MSSYLINETGVKAKTLPRVVGCSNGPEVDLSLCNGCGGCIEVAPEIFRFNESFGFIEVIEQDSYDPDLVAEAVKNCPKKAISRS